MNRVDENSKFVRPDDDLNVEPKLREAIGNFKSSVDAWSEATASRPREIVVPARKSWRLASKWALGCTVFIATVSGAVYSNHRQLEAEKMESARIAQQQRQLLAERAKEEAELMAKVDSDIAREVPSALEPLASLMDENKGTGN
jgi:hypothetical protein